MPYAIDSLNLRAGFSTRAASPTFIFRTWWSHGAAGHRSLATRRPHALPGPTGKKCSEIGAGAAGLHRHAGEEYRRSQDGMSGSVLLLIREPGAAESPAEDLSHGLLRPDVELSPAFLAELEWLGCALERLTFGRARPLPVLAPFPRGRRQQHVRTVPDAIAALGERVVKQIPSPIRACSRDLRSPRKKSASASIRAMHVQHSFAPRRFLCQIRSGFRNTDAESPRTRLSGQILVDVFFTLS